MEFKKNFKYMIIGVIALLVIAMVTAGDTVITNSGITSDGGTFNGNIDMNDNPIINIGNSGTDFDSDGGLNLKDSLNLNQGNPDDNIIDIQAEHNFKLSNYNTDSTLGTLYIRGNGTTGEDLYGAGIQFGNLGDHAQTHAAIVPVQTGSDSNNVGLSFITNAAGGSGNLQESVRIDHEGDVGIGTDNPSAKLDVDGDVEINGFVNHGNNNEITISSGEITVDSSFVDVIGEGDANDMLTTINGGTTGDELFIFCRHQITFEDNTGNIDTASDDNDVFNQYNIAHLIKVGANWRLINNE